MESGNGIQIYRYRKAGQNRQEDNAVKEALKYICGRQPGQVSSSCSTTELEMLIYKSCFCDPFQNGLEYPFLP